MFKQVPSSWATSHCPRRSTPSRGSKRCRSTPFVKILLRASRKYFFSCSPFHLAKVQWQVQGSSPQCPELCLIFWGMGGGGYSTTSISNWYIIWIEKQSCLETYMSSASLSSALSGCLTCHFGMEHHFNPFAPAGLTQYLPAQPYFFQNKNTRTSTPICTTPYEHFWALPPCAQGQGCPYKPGQLCYRDHLSWKLFWIDSILHWFSIFNVKFTPRGLISILFVADQLVPCERQSRSRTWNRKHPRGLEVIVFCCL